MPSVAAGLVTMCLSMLLKRAKAFTASSLCARRDSRSSDGRSTARMWQVGRRGVVHGVVEVQRHRVQVHRHAALDDFRDRLEAHPGAREARQRPAVQAELQVLGHVGRVHQRHAPGLQGLVALVRRAAGHAAVVVPADDENPALGRRAIDVAMLQRVARAVHAGPLAVPQGEHAIDRALRVQRHALHAQAGGGGQVFVDGGQEFDVGRFEELLRLPQLLVHHAQRRAAVTGDEAGGVQAGALVELLLRQQQPHEGLRAGQEDGAAVGGEVVAELVGTQRGLHVDGGGFGHGGTPGGAKFLRRKAGRNCLIACGWHGR